MKSGDELLKRGKLDATLDSDKRYAYFDERLGVTVRLEIDGNESKSTVEDLFNSLLVTVSLNYVDSEDEGSNPLRQTPQTAFGPIPGPATPSPIPEGSEQFSKSQGVFVSTTLFEGSEKSLTKGEVNWVCNWIVNVDAVRVRMNFSKPSAALTTTITLRDKQNESKSVESTVNCKNTEDDDDIIDDWDSIDLLEGVSPLLRLPSSRLTQTYQNDDIPSHNIPEKTLKRSCRIVIPISSAFSVRMRAVNIPSLLHRPEDDKPHLVLGLELENCIRNTFMVTDVGIRMKEASIADDNDELIGRRHELTQSDLPAQLQAGEQHNLIYIIVFKQKEVQPVVDKSRQSKEFNRPRRFNVRINVLAHTENGSVFDMKWNSFIDISNALVEDWKKYNNTTDTVTARPTSMNTNSSKHMSGPVAGNRRFTLTNLQHASEMAAATSRQQQQISEESDSESTDSTTSNLGSVVSSKENVLVSVSVLKPTKSIKLAQRSPSIFSPQINTPAKESADLIKTFDIFPVELFLFNKSTLARRFVVAFPNHNQINSRNQSMSFEERLLDDIPNPNCDAGIIPLENFVRFGPLQPGSCQSVNVNFLALREGVHTIDQLELYDPDTGFSSRLKNVSTVVVK
ncbi:hypothetical protein E3Q13_02454 [Wallemia mellicola]|nr:hypothetical protein E3Q13_02454 [Wallemia mellicola]